MNKKVVTLDVREDIRRGREPLSKILQAVGALKNRQALLLIAPFKPVPLFKLLAQRGFSYDANPTAEGDWEVLFTQKGAPPKEESASSPPTTTTADSPICTGTPVVELDARGLEPPQPLIKILEAVATLPEGVRLRALTDRRPMHLYAQLEERGFVGETQEQKDGTFVTYVGRR